jgi:hypothetical protein
MMQLTGSPDRPLGPPDGLLNGVDRLGSRFPGLNALGLLGERAAITGMRRAGATSCGGSCRLLETADGWIAVSLPRPEDMESVPAWLHLAEAPDTRADVWPAVARGVRDRSTPELVEQAILLGLPVAGVSEEVDRPGVVTVPLGDAGDGSDVRGLVVVDLSTMWAGPLCGDLLARAGATVVKVESTARPDGARFGSSMFFDLLNGNKTSVALDLQRSDGVSLLHQLVRRADIVLESSRPRALEQFGIVAADMVATGSPRVWISITGYGRSGPAAYRVAFGDDAAAAGGLVVWDDGAPMFCGDAIADPLSGLAAADACLRALESGGRWLLDVALSAVAAELTGPTLPVTAAATAAEPQARQATGKAPALGVDTRCVLTQLGVVP